MRQLWRGNFELMDSSLVMAVWQIPASELVRVLYSISGAGDRTAFTTIKGHAPGDGSSPQAVIDEIIRRGDSLTQHRVQEFVSKHDQMGSISVETITEHRGEIVKSLTIITVT